MHSLAVRPPWPGDEGQGVAEYALILGLIAIVAILSLVFLGDSLADLMSMIGSMIEENS
jgi:Flp pilus assembly pilin Flp